MNNDLTGQKTLVLLYPGCIAFEVMLACELLNETFPLEIATPDGADHHASNGMVIKAHTDYAGARIQDHRCVLVPGGDTYEVLENQALDRLLQDAYNRGVWIGAICAGPLLLAKAGLLKGKSFTHGFGDHHQEFLAPFWHGASFQDAPLIVDGTIVTAQPQAHIDFGVEVARLSGAIDAGRAHGLAAYHKVLSPATIVGSGACP